MAQAKSEIEEHLEILECQLAGRECLADCYSMVEICYTPFVEFFGLIEITPPPGVAAWTARSRRSPRCERGAQEPPLHPAARAPIRRIPARTAVPMSYSMHRIRKGNARSRPLKVKCVIPFLLSRLRNSS